MATALLAQANLSDTILDHWESLGGAVIALFATRSLIGSAAWETSGKASLAAAALHQQIYQHLSQELQFNGLFSFGVGVTEAEKSSASVLTSLVNQLVGGYCYLKGYSNTAKQLLMPLVPMREIEIPLGKDCKTLLQELCHANKLGFPIYTLISSDGPANNLTFTSQVTDSLGRATEGRGRSKRFAEQVAAAAFLGKYFPAANSKLQLALVPEFDVSDASRAIPRLPNTSKAEHLGNLLGLPDWSTNLLSLAFVHASYTGTTIDTRFGKDNRLLALLGSAILQWASRDAILRLADHASLAEAGGLQGLVKLAISAELLLVACSDILRLDLYLTGPGEKSLHMHLRLEMVQAFVGALYLAREERVETGSDLFKSVTGLANYFSEIARRPNTREDLQDAKTRLQERCQSIGVAATYVSEVSKNSGTTIFEPRIRLSSHRVGNSLLVLAPKREFLAHTFGGKKALEGELAEILIETFDIATGRKTKDAPQIENKLSSVEQWLLRHLIGEVSACHEIADRARISRLIKGNILGTALLRNGDFIGFEKFLLRAINAFDDNLHVEVERLHSFFFEAGKVSAKNIVQARLASDLKDLASFLRSLDPLNTSINLRETRMFRALIQQAAACRIIGGELVESTLEDILAQSLVIFRRRGIDLRILAKETITILEIEGSHLALIDLLIQYSDELQMPCPPITFQGHDGSLEITLEKPQNCAGSLLDQLSRSAIWSALRQLLPITNAEENPRTLRLLISSPKKHKLALQCWWSFHLRGPLEIVANDTIATVLHDMKNELLAFEAASLLAQESRNHKEKYQFAADASRHIEHALSRVDVVRALIQSSQTLPIDSFAIGAFVRSIITELWSWIPTGITFVPPSTASESQIWTNKDALRSIIINLSSNAMEAMEGRGTFEIEYIVDDDATHIEFEINDTGPGFTASQLNSLNCGSPVSSSKRNGPGIGLLTVQMLIKELGGFAKFSTNPNGGSRINLRFPSLPPLTESAQGLDDMQESIDVSVTVAIV